MCLIAVYTTGFVILLLSFRKEEWAHRARACCPGSHGEVDSTAESHGVLLPNDQPGASEAPGAFSAGAGMETN